jgi:hypothetical protein
MTGFLGIWGKEEAAIRPKLFKKDKYVNPNRPFFLPIVPTKPLSSRDFIQPFCPHDLLTTSSLFRRM